MARPGQLRNTLDLLLVVFLLSSLNPALADQSSPPTAIYEGRALSSVLDELRELGLSILYSDAVVRPEMTVTRNPRASDPREILEEILDEHPLAIQEMSDGQLVIVPKNVRTGSLVVELGVSTTYSGTATVEITGTGHRIRSTSRIITIDDVPVGSREVVARVPGFVPRTFEVRITAETPTRLLARLEPIHHLEQIVVMPDQLSLRKESLAEERHLSATEIDISPHVGDDLMRAVSSAPGVTESDFSARFNPRGGGETETLVMLDGVELYEPFHLKDFLNIFSIIDSEAVEEVDLLTGAFTAEYGDRMSAVMDISIQKPREPGSELMLGTLNSRVLSTGTFRDTGEWLITARGWYPTRLPDSAGFLEGTTIAADYYDVLARMSYPISSRTSLSLGLLAAYDDVSFREVDGIDTARISAKYQSDQSWAAWDGNLSDTTIWRATASITNIDRDRQGEEIDSEDGHLIVEDNRSFRSIDARSDWSWNIVDLHLLRWGAGLRSQEADYDYSRALTLPDDEPSPTPIDLTLEPDGYGYHAYASDRFRLGNRIVTEIGVRWDYQDWTTDAQISPRVNVKIDLTSRSELRLGWGRFHQSQRVNELAVEDGFTQFDEAEFSQHAILSLIHTFENNWTLRGVLYEKEFDQLRPRYENLFSRLELFPESRTDRVLVAPTSAEARGLELMLRNSLANRFSWWLGYTRAEAQDVIDGRNVPRSWDQKQTVNGAIAFELPWEVKGSLGGTWHSGRPTTPISIELEEDDGELEAIIIPGSRNASRLPDYFRLDLRLSRQFPLRHGSGEVIIQAFNLTNRKNVCYIEDFEIEIEAGAARVTPEVQICSPIIPTLSLGWKF